MLVDAGMTIRFYNRQYDHIKNPITCFLYGIPPFESKGLQLCPVQYNRQYDHIKNPITCFLYGIPPFESQYNR